MFENASKNYKAKKSLLADNNLTENDYVLPDFSTASVSKIKVETADIPLNLNYWEDIARKVSKEFEDYPKITGSGVSASIIKTTSYYLNSEGTEYDYPMNIVNLEIFATANDSNNIGREKSLNYTGRFIEDIPTLDSLKKACHLLVDLLTKEVANKSLNESYSGPIMFEKRAASNVLLSSLFSNNGLIAQRKPLNMQGYNFHIPTQPESNSIESKIGQQVVSKQLTVKSLSKLKNYKGIELWGHFNVDAEGVVPPDELTLIENGTLKTLLNDRVPTFAVKKSNGHSRINGIWGNSLSPGVLQVTANNNMPVKNMKQKLIQLAKENGNDFCFIVREHPLSSEKQTYKVNLENGNETLVNTGRIKSVKMKDLKNKVIFSDNEQVVNLVNRGIFTSVISPDALIVKNLEVYPIRNSFKNKPSVVKNPLAN